MITPDNTALVVIDIQGKLASMMFDKEAFFLQTERLIQAINLLNIPIIWAEQVPDKLGPTVEEIAIFLNLYQPIKKTTFSCTRNPQFLEELNRLDKEYLLICGIETHICVFQTVSGLLQLGKKIHVVSDATASRSLSNKQIGINRMESEGAIITSLEMCLFEMLQDVNADQFRTISKLIK